jgi:hypothetical protein
MIPPQDIPAFVAAYLAMHPDKTLTVYDRNLRQCGLDTPAALKEWLDHNNLLGYRSETSSSSGVKFMRRPE